MSLCFHSFEQYLVPRFRWESTIQSTHPSMHQLHHYIHRRSDFCLWMHPIEDRLNRCDTQADQVYTLGSIDPSLLHLDKVRAGTKSGSLHSKMYYHLGQKYHQEYRNRLYK